MTSQLLQKEDRDYVSALFRSSLERPVRLLFFTSKESCTYCQQTEQLLKEVSDQSQEKISLDVVDRDVGRRLADELQIGQVPATVVFSSNGTKQFFFGMPSGFQLKPFVEALVDASAGSTGLSDEIKQKIRTIDRPVEIKVFVTPVCPYSPLVVRAAHRFSMENPLIRAQMIESMEFGDLTRKYHVVGVPKTVINETYEFEGALGDEAFSEMVVEAAVSCD